MAMVWFKACARCTGDLCRDPDGEIHCLACGYRPVTRVPALALVDPRLLPRERPGRKQATEPKPKENRSSRQYARKLAQRYSAEGG